MSVRGVVFFIFLLTGGLRGSTQDSPFVKLKEVTITGKKQLFEQKTDRMVINVRNSITSTGGTALDVLEKAPGVSVDRQGNRIAVNGKNGVAVMINGKMTYMPADALTQFLAGVSAGNIEKIELMTTPPAKYDAGGNAGFINIVLVDNPYAGISGSYFLTAGYGYRESAAAGGNFNYRGARLNLYGSYSFNYDHNIQESSGFVQYNKAGDVVTNTTSSYRDAHRPVNNLRIGMDYQLDSANVIGVLVSGYISRWSMVAKNSAIVSRNHVPDTIIHSVDDPEVNQWKNLMTNINFQHTYKAGKVLSFDVSHVYYKDDNPNTYATDYYDGKEAFLYHEDLRSGKTTPIRFQVYSSSLTTALGKKVKMDLGAKAAFSAFTNNVYSDDLKQGGWERNAALTASYSLKEHIGAAYASFIVDPGNDISITAGLRYEYTDSRLGSTKGDEINRKYGELFPTFTFSKKIDGDNGISFSYSRRITRPAFSDLAPFTVFFDPKTFYSGNPALQPAIAHALQAGYGYKRYSLTVNYTYEKNTISSFYFQTHRIDTVGNMLYFSPRNFKYQRYLTASLSVPVRVAGWWEMQYNIDWRWKEISTAFDDASVLLRNMGVNLVSVQRLALPGKVALEISGSYASTDLAGTARRKAFLLLDAGVQKKLGGDDHILRLAFNDVFNTGGSYRFGENLPSGAVLERRFDFNNRGAKLTYSYNFGNHALKGKRDRVTGAEDELKRVAN